MKKLILLQWLLFILLLLLLIWDVGLYLTPEKTTPWHYGFNLGYSLMYTLGAAISFTATRNFGLQTNLGKTLLFFGAGLLTFAIALWIWAYFNLFLGTETPYPSAPDVFFLLQYPLFALGFYSHLKNYHLFQTQRFVLQTLALFACITIILLAIQQFSAEKSTNLIIILFNSSYQIGDALLITLAINGLRIGGGFVYKSLKPLIAGFLFLASADQLFAYQVGKGIYWNGHLPDLLYTLAGFFMAWSMIQLIKQTAPLENRLNES